MIKGVTKCIAPDEAKFRQATRDHELRGYARTHAEFAFNGTDTPHQGGLHRSATWSIDGISSPCNIHCRGAQRSGRSTGGAAHSCLNAHRPSLTNGEGGRREGSAAATPGSSPCPESMPRSTSQTYSIYR